MIPRLREHAVPFRPLCFEVNWQQALVLVYNVGEHSESEVVTVYRKSKLSADPHWHFHTTCSAWPETDFEQVVDCPSDEPPCAGCTKLEKALFPQIKLRDHPCMTRVSGKKTWPPLWVDTRGTFHAQPRGEIGVLKKIEQHAGIANSIFLLIEHEGQSYIGMLNFDDTVFCREIGKVLDANIGHTIKTIGDLDLSYTL